MGLLRVDVHEEPGSGGGGQRWKVFVKRTEGCADEAQLTIPCTGRCIGLSTLQEPLEEVVLSVGGSPTY